MISRGVLPFLAVTIVAASASVGAQPTQGGPLPTPLPLFPASNWWNLDISQAPVDPSSPSYINHINANGLVHLHPDFGGEEDPTDPTNHNIYGMPYVVVDGTQAKVAVKFDYWDESDGVDPTSPTHEGTLFYPIPEQAKTQEHWIEGGNPGNVPPDGDRHMLIVDRTNNYLYELYHLYWNGTKWTAGSGAFFDMKTNNRRPEGWTSADAAGLAILPGLLRYDEVYTQAGEIGHALRMTVRDSNGHTYPGSHTAGSQAGALPMGARLRLNKNKTIPTSLPAPVQKIFQAMKKYGLIVADNGTDMYIGGTFDTRWDNDVLNPAFNGFTASDFEVVQLGYRATPTATAPARATPTATPSPSATATATATLTPTTTARATATFTVRPTATSTARPTATATARATSTATVRATATATSAATPSAATSFYTLTPCRVLDTRGVSAPALQGGMSRTFTLTGQCGIPSTARALSVNVTVTQPTTAGDLRIYPTGTALPPVSVINYGAGQTRANNAMVMLGSGGGIVVRCDQPAGATVQLILDVNGYFQ